ncbi:MAG TPA: hypothetical protein VMF90_11325 [Rhizobiaceae bacterium]|nr:hypothetical protein [Rhizobiaceae bacterium]
MSDAQAVSSPDAVKVEALAGYGLTAAEIALVLNTDADVLATTFDRELRSGRVKANARVAESLYRKAVSEGGKESVTAAIFWLKSRAHWKETNVTEVRHDVADPVAALLQRIAENGRRIHDLPKLASSNGELLQ